MDRPVPVIKIRVGGDADIRHSTSSAWSIHCLVVPFFLLLEMETIFTRGLFFQMGGSIKTFVSHCGSIIQYLDHF